MKSKRLFPVSFAVALLGLASGCSSNECYDNHSALPLATFYSASTLRPVSVQGLSIYGLGAPNDSVLYTPQNLQEAYLPFRLWQDTTVYVFAYTGLLPDSIAEVYPELVPRDTVRFIYKPKEWFVSPACGAMYFYDMKTVEHTSLLIDSISWKDLITNENVSNMQFFFKDRIGD